ncbi:MAG: D-alanyl-D-alanine carboxypeptidase/D-alanyl-D-alanine-endopeptidase [Chlamydiae bacterium]|nr:D-alanyl-D-alanine carboxypeptidase/D-alanyl-D-alanine-endopeptidase [Chlamydiota bacterium]
MKKIGYLFAFMIFVCSIEAKNKVEGFQHTVQRGIEKIIQSVDPKTHIGIEIISLKDGELLYEKNGHHLFVPASNLKLFTAAAALSLLGSDFTFETSLFYDGEMENERIKGNLYLKGGGDPSLSTSDLEEMILGLRLMQIKEIQGDLVIDHFDFDQFCLGPGWMWDEEPAYWNSPVSGLVVNHSCVNIWIKPSKKIASNPKIFIFPKTEEIKVLNLASTEENPSSNLTIERRQNEIQIKGEIGLNNPIQKYAFPLEEPHLYAGNLFKALFQKNGIELKGALKVNPLPLQANKLLSHHSAPLSLLIRKMLKESDNLYADAFFKKMGQTSFQQGSWQMGAKAVRDFLEKKAELDVIDSVVLDGCGLSRYNLVSPHQTIELLKWVYKSEEIAPEFISALPVAAVDGSLKQRMNEDPEVKGKVRAKCGTMTGISSISGYATTQDGEKLAFSIFINGFTGPANHYKNQIEDRICTFLANLSRD